MFGMSLEHITHRLQVLNLTHYRFNIFAWLLKPLNFFITLKQAVDLNDGNYLYHKRLIHGENFVCGGGVWLCSFEDIKKALIEPQARAYLLAPSPLDPNHLPCTNVGGRLNFLLSLSNRGAGGNGEWEAYRKAFEDYITNSDEASIRMNDEISNSLLVKLREEYKVTKMGGEFFSNNDRGLHDFLLRYLHYVLFGLDPNDEEKMQTINTLHYDSSSAAYYLKYLGKALQYFKFRKWPEQIQAVAKVYADSPALSSFEDGQEKYNNLTRFELSMLAVSIMSLAGMVGPKTLAWIIVGERKLNAYDGQMTGEIDVIKEWDKLDLTDRDEVKRYIYECGRLRNPVSNTHRVATEDFTVMIGRKNVTFKKGTIIFIPLLLAGLNESVWGSTTFQFDHNRKNLCPFSTFFHSFGEQTNGRICPGKAIAEHMLTEMLITLGEYRRSKKD